MDAELPVGVEIEELRAPSSRRPVARYGGLRCFSTASAGGERSASPCSSSTITSPFGSVANWTMSPAIAGASAVAKTSHPAGRGVARV